LGKQPGDVELHARHFYGGGGPWKGIDVEVRKDMYRAVIGLLPAHDCYVSHASIDKPKLAEKYNYPHSPYLLALQFLCEKLDAWAGTFEKSDPSRSRIMLVADETKEHETRAVTLVADMQRWGSDLVSGRTLPRIIDTLHYVSSAASPGVQMADAVAFVLQRQQWKKTPPDLADEFIPELAELVWDRTPTYRMTWPMTWST